MNRIPMIRPALSDRSMCMWVPFCFSMGGTTATAMEMAKIIA